MIIKITKSYNYKNSNTFNYLSILDQKRFDWHDKHLEVTVEIGWQDSKEDLSKLVIGSEAVSSSSSFVVVEKQQYVIKTFWLW